MPHAQPPQACPCGIPKLTGRTGPMLKPTATLALAFRRDDASETFFPMRDRFTLFDQAPGQLGDEAGWIAPLAPQDTSASGQGPWPRDWAAHGLSVKTLGAPYVPTVCTHKGLVSKSGASPLGAVRLAGTALACFLGSFTLSFLGQEGDYELPSLGPVDGRLELALASGEVGGVELQLPIIYDFSPETSPPTVLRFQARPGVRRGIFLNGPIDRYPYFVLPLEVSLLGQEVKAAPIQTPEFLLPDILLRSVPRSAL